MTDRPNSRLCIFVENVAEEAARFYAATLPDTHVEAVHPIAPGMAVALWRCLGTPYMLMDGNDRFEPRNDHSISVTTLDQAETDRLWHAMAEGGAEGPCGWLRDRYGVHWQLVPAAATHLLSDPDREAAARAQAVMRSMRKINLAAMQAAFEGRA